MSDDPHYQREKEKYENPVASREYLMSLLKEHDKPLSFLDICNLVNAFDEEARIGIQRRLRAMEREGQVQFTKQKKYILQNRDELIKGRIIGHRDGYGFLRPEDKSGDLFISAGQMNLFMHDDVVEVVPKLLPFRLVHAIARLKICQNLRRNRAFACEWPARGKFHQRPRCDDQNENRRNRDKNSFDNVG